MNATPDSHRSMLAVRAHWRRGPDVLAGGTVARPQPHSDELLVAVYAADKEGATQISPSCSSRASRLREKESTKFEVVQNDYAHARAGIRDADRKSRM
jgi:hypothetical protein